MKDFPPIGTRVRWNHLTPNTKYHDATGVVVRRSCHEAGGHIEFVIIQVDENSPVKPPMMYSTARDPRFLDLFGPTEDEIDEALTGIDRILEDT